jgi:hypothetical protein
MAVFRGRASIVIPLLSRINAIVGKQLPGSIVSSKWLSDKRGTGLLSTPQGLAAAAKIEAPPRRARANCRISPSEKTNTSEHALLTMYGRILDLGGIGLAVSCPSPVVRSNGAAAVHQFATDN